MFSCNACSVSDPTQDTVKFDAAAIVAQQQQREREAAEQQRQAAEEARRVEEEAAERKRIQEQQQREQELLRRQQAEEEARQRALAEDAERQRIQLEELQRIEDEQRRAQEAEAARLAAQQQQRERLARDAAEAKARKVAIDGFLKQHGFKSGVSGAKKSMMSTTYPLHAAAKEGDAKMVEMLLREGANAAQTNSSGKTPVQVAEKTNKGSSHAPVLRALAGGAAFSVGAGGRVGGC